MDAHVKAAIEKAYLDGEHEIEDIDGAIAQAESNIVSWREKLADRKKRQRALLKALGGKKPTPPPIMVSAAISPIGTYRIDYDDDLGHCDD